MGKIRNNLCSSTALLWFDTCPPARTSLPSDVCSHSSEVLQMSDMLLRAILICVSSTQKEGQSRQRNKNHFHIAFYSIQRLKFECVTNVHEFTFLPSLMMVLLKMNSWMLLPNDFSRLLVTTTHHTHMHPLHSNSPRSKTL